MTDNFGQIQNLQCISGSRTPDVGRWIAPNGQDITYSNGDPFEIIIGRANDPGYLEIRQDARRSLRFTDQGIYTCLIPDESGANMSLHVGIYLPAYTSKLL